MPRDFDGEPRLAEPQDRLTRSAYRALVCDGVFSQALSVLTSGALLIGCALASGASPAYVGVLSAIPFFAQLAHLPAVVLIERVRRRKAICVAATLGARAMLLPLVLVPLLGDRSEALALLLLCFAVVSPLGAVGGCAWMSWTCELVPRARLGAVFARRQLCANFAAMVAGLVGAALVDGWARRFPLDRLGGYAGVFALAILMALASTWFLTHMPDVPMGAPPPSLAGLFARPFRDRNFRKVMLFLGGWSFAVNLAMPFFTVFLVQDLGTPITVPIVMGVAGQVANILSLPFWGRFSDRSSNKAVIALAGPVLLAATACWALAALTFPAVLVLPFLFLVQAVAGAAGAGLDLACGNLAFKAAERSAPTVYLGVNGLVKSVAGGMAPLAGGILAQHLGGTQLVFALGGLAVLHLHPLAVVFLASVAAGAVALLFLVPVAEEGRAVLRRPLFRYMRRPKCRAEGRQDGAVRNRPAGAA